MSIAIVLTIHTTEVDPHPTPHTISIGRDFLSVVWAFRNPQAPYYFSLQLSQNYLILLLVLYTIALLLIAVDKYILSFI